MRYLPLLFLMSCVPNTMSNHILDNTEQTHYYLSDDIKDGSTHWCLMHTQMEKIKINKPSVTSKWVKK